MKAKVVNSIGEKVQKKVTNGTNIKTTDYLEVMFHIGTFIRNQNIKNLFSVCFRKYFRNSKPACKLALSFSSLFLKPEPVQNTASYFRGLIIAH